MVQSDTDPARCAGIPEFLNRTVALIGPAAIRELQSKTVAIAGCGGVGGGVAITLARMGVGGFTLSDPGCFDPPDANRQWGATRETMGHYKCKAYGTILASINPDVRIRRCDDGISDDNVEEFLADADILVDCLDVSVPTHTRMRLFRHARERGIYSVSAPILGFGTVMIVGAPDGMPMEAVFGQMVADAAQESRLPRGLWQIFVPEHLDASEQMLEQHRVPSVAPSVVAATSLVSTESVLILLGATFTGWRPPVCLPHATVFEPLRGQYRTMHIRELANPSESESGPRDVCDAPALALSESRPHRRRWLERCGFNVALLPQDEIPLDLMTDSWSEIESDPITQPGPPSTHERPEDHLQALYGYPYNVPVFRGRFAESLLAQVMVKRGTPVVTNGLFPSTRFHLQSAGARLHEIPVPEAYDVSASHPFKGDLDPVALEKALAEGAGLIYVELCNNALGGHPVSLDGLRRTRELATAHGVPVVLDTTRAFENAWLMRQRDPACADRSLVSLVRDMCSLSDACAASLCKDFALPVGAFVGVRDEKAFVHLRDLALLATGTGLKGDDAAVLAAGLSSAPDSDAGAAGRAAQVDGLWQVMNSAGIPLARPSGGHAVYVDVNALLPGLAGCAFAPEALAASLFELGGLRTIRNMNSPGQLERGVSLMRLAIPVNGYRADELGRAVAAFEAILADPSRVKPLERQGRPQGKLGIYTAQYAEASPPSGN